MSALGQKRIAERAAMLGRIIEALSAGEVHRDVLRDQLGLSSSGLRTYLGDLDRAGIVDVAWREVPTRGNIGKPVYHLTAAREEIDAFLAKVAEVPRCADEKDRRTIGRTIHIMGDDAPFRARIERGPVVLDPYALPAAFFSRAGSGSITKP